MVAQARACLLDLLLDSTQQERLDATWEVLFGESESDVRHDVSLEECLLVVQECQTIPLHYVKNGLRSLVESLSDVFPRHVQTVAQSHCKEYCIHSLSLHHSTSKEDAGDASREVNDDNEYVITFASQKRRDIVIMANVERNAHGTQLISVLLLRKGSCAREITTDEGEFIDLFCQFIVNCVWCTLS
ncbi:hypothetical protein AGDE_13461 [Angomonas deanei]|nr:hypothetical protein AGDE_13461 [Angomonas deanei]|eukprot:EPY22277.1 hypothetical protein AGDE_13461 [Angomonas deanei]